MMARLFFLSTFVFVSLCSLQASTAFDDEQKKLLVEKITKKVQCAQAAGKSSEMIMNELMCDVVAAIDETTDFISAKNKKLIKTVSIVVGVVGAVVGLYWLYDRAQKRKAEKAVERLQTQRERAVARLLDEMLPSNVEVALAEAVRDLPPENFQNLADAIIAHRALPRYASQEAALAAHNEVLAQFNRVLNQIPEHHRYVFMRRWNVDHEGVRLRHDREHQRQQRERDHHERQERQRERYNRRRGHIEVTVAEVVEPVPAQPWPVDDITLIEVIDPEVNNRENNVQLLGNDIN